MTEEAVLVATLRVYAGNGLKVPAELLERAADAIERLDGLRPRPIPVSAMLGEPRSGRAGELLARVRRWLAPGQWASTPAALPAPAAPQAETVHPDTDTDPDKDPIA